MKAKFLTTTLLSFACLGGIFAMQAPAHTANAQEAEPVAITKANSELFLPSEYEQYLSLQNPSDVAFCDGYFAVADGSTLYVYHDNEYRSFTLIYNEEERTISKLQFAENGLLYLSDTDTNFYSLDVTQENFNADRKTDVQCSTFYIEKNVLYTATVSNSTTLNFYLLDTLAKIHSDTPQIIGTPRITRLNDTVLCSLNSVVYAYQEVNANIFAQPTTFQLSQIPAEVVNISSLCTHNGNIYFTSSTGLYRTDKDANCVQLLQKDNLTALSSYAGELYCISGNAVRKLDVTQTEATFTDYEITSASQSVGRLTQGNLAVRAGNILALSDEILNRITVYDFKSKQYTTISCQSTPTQLATDGKTIAVASGREIYLYEYDDGSATFTTSIDATGIVTGVTVCFGTTYYVTQTGYYGAVETGQVANRGNTPRALTSDLYGNLYVVTDDNAVTRYTEAEFVDKNINSEKEPLFTIPQKNYFSLRCDFFGNLYYLTDENGSIKLYKNDTVSNTINSQDVVYGHDTAPVSFALGYEDQTIYFLYDHFMTQTTAVEIPLLTMLPHEMVQNGIFTVQSSLTLGTVNANSVGVRTNLEQLQKNENEYFPYEGYLRSEERKGIVLAQTTEYVLLAFYRQANEYDTILFRDEDVTTVTQTVTPSEAHPAYLTSDVSPRLFPCLTSVLEQDRLERTTKVTVLGQVSEEYAGTPFALVEYQTETGTKTGYIPLSYLTEIPPANGSVSYRYETLDEDVTMTAPDGSEIVVKKGSKVRITESEKGLIASCEKEGVTYTATVTEDQLVQPASDAFRISAIVVLCVLGAIVIGCFLILPKRKRRNTPQ